MPATSMPPSLLRRPSLIHMTTHAINPLRRSLSMASKMPKRFAPLKPPTEPSNAPAEPRLRGVVFDMDGTLCKPQNHMFKEMRAALNIPKSTDILAHIESLPPPSQPAAMDSIRAIERTAMASQTPQPGLARLMEYLDRHVVPKAICTRNFDAPVQHLLAEFLSHTVFDPVVTRAFKPPKPHPAGILYIAERWGLDNAEGLIMVGDSVDDMVAGRRAGAATVLLVNDENRHLEKQDCTDVAIERLDDLMAILDDGFPATALEADDGVVDNSVIAQEPTSAGL